MDIEFFEHAEDVYLEVEANPKSADQFEHRYAALVGVNPAIGRGYQHQPNKWGTEVRVYFNSDIDLSDEFAAIDVYVEHGSRPYRNQWAYRTNDREFFWALVEAGYRLGQN